MNRTAGFWSIERVFRRRFSLVFGMSLAAAVDDYQPMIAEIAKAIIRDEDRDMLSHTSDSDALRWRHS